MVRRSRTGAVFDLMSRRRSGAIFPTDWGNTPWGVATFNKRTRSEAVGTLVLTNIPQ